MNQNCPQCGSLLGATATFDATISHVPDRAVEAGAKSVSAESASTRFGDYEILEEIAHGGMGVVYKARQAGLNRIVALKMILAGQLAGEQQIRRFYAEAEAAAQLDHPGIVPVYEVGQHQGRHYFSMGFVQGTSLAGRLAEGPLEPREAARLVHEVARAVHYAHQRGVIHRDLKPSNILVDGSGQPRVTDFGLAKQVESGAELTHAGAVLGTPSFMPPEQAAGRMAEVGPLADVYALGATLYCLVTGRPPFQSAQVAETLRQVLQQEPVSPRQLNTALDHDLETICLKCLQKEPRQRYATAGDLADDLQRYLERRPIVARPLSPPARLARWCRRSPRVAALAVSLVLALVSGVIVSSYFAIQASFNAGRYQAESLRANDEAQNALASLANERKALAQYKAQLRATEAAIDNYVRTVKGSELLRDVRLQPLMKDLLKDALAHYESYIEEHQQDDDAATQQRLAQALSEVASINIASGSQNEAIAAHERALAIGERLVKDHPDVAEHLSSVATTLNDLANLYSATGKLEEAEAAYERALAMRERLSREHGGAAEYRNALATSLNNFGAFCLSGGKPREALDAYERARTIRQELVKEHPASQEYRSGLAGVCLNLGNLYRATGKPADALAVQQQALALWRELAEEDPASKEYRSAVARIQLNLGNLYAATGKADDAIAAYRDALAVQERLASEFPTITDYHNNLARIHLNAGNLFRAIGKSREATDAYERALALWERLARENPEVTAFESSLANTYNSLAANLYTADEFDQALAAYERALAIRERRAKANPTVPEHQNDVAASCSNIALVYRMVKKPDESLAYYRRALSIFERLAREYPALARHRSDLAECRQQMGILFHETGQLDQARPEYEQALMLRERIVEEEPEVTEHQVNLAGTHITMGILTGKSDTAEGLKRLDTAIELLQRVLKREPRHAAAQQFLRNARGARAQLVAGASGRGCT